MPLTPFQYKLAQLLASNRTEASHLAGGAALHFQPNSIRYSEDLDYFHDSEAQVFESFSKDRRLLEDKGYTCELELSQPGYIRCIIKKGQGATKVEWARDSSWRFMPVQAHKELGYVLHPIDLAINKVLALAGRDEPRDYLDVLHVHETTLPLGALCWAACGKDPGYNPKSLMELLKRRGKYRPEDFKRLHLTVEYRQILDVQELKAKWLQALSDAEDFIQTAPFAEVGCLYYSLIEKKFIQPKIPINPKETLLHYGRLGGVLPQIL